MTDTPYPEAHELLHALRKLRNINRHGGTFHGLKTSEMGLLLRIRHCSGPEGMKVTEISSLLRVTSPTVTQLVNDLAKRGLLERMKDAADGRVVRIRVTAEGERLSLMAQQELLTGLQQAILHMGGERSRLLIELLEELHRFIEEKSSGYPPQSQE